MSLNEIGGDLEGIQRFLRDLGGFWKIEPLFGGSFGLPMILRHFEGCTLDFGGFQRIPGISQKFGGIYRILLIFKDFCSILRFSNI